MVLCSLDTQTDRHTLLPCPARHASLVYSTPVTHVILIITAQDNYGVTPCEHCFVTTPCVLCILNRQQSSYQLWT